MELYHHSRNLLYRNPQGAVPCKTAITLRLDIRRDVTAQVAVLVHHANGSYLVPMERKQTYAEAIVTVEGQPQRMQYCFRIQQGETIRYYGAESGEGRLTEQPIFYGITVFDGAFETPEWFRHAVCYQIFPDRFFRSSKETFLERAESYQKSGRPMFVHESWEEEPLYEAHGGMEDYNPDDYFGGDLNGIREKLPYLKDLGIDCIYLNPIFSAHSNHRYNTADYRTIDSLLGTNEDFDALAEEANRLGIRLILDGVFSHTGDDSIYFDRYHRYGTGACTGVDSPYYPWYRFTEYPASYECWWGFGTLPNVEELTESYVEFIQGQDGILKHWLRHGASGWRLDVADELPDAFIRGIRRSIKEQDPDAVLMGEVWDNCATKVGPEGRRAYVNGDLLDSAMNYPFRDATLAFLRGHIDAYDYAGWLQTIREDYPKPFFDACLNLLDSHDTGRTITMLTNCPPPKSMTRSEQVAFVPTEEALERAKRLFLTATALQMTLPGVPCIYYGNELGLEGMRDPFNRRTMPWGRGDERLFPEIQKLVKMRKETRALSDGKLRMGAIGKDQFAVIRYTEDETVILLVNRSDADRTAVLYPGQLYEGADGNTPVPFAGTYADQNGRTVSANTCIVATVPKNGYLLLTRM